MTYINNNTGQSYNFVTPNKKIGTNDYFEETFPCTDVQALTLSSNKADAKMNATTTILDLGSENLSAAATITLTETTAPVGSRLFVKFKCGGTKYDVSVKIGDVTTTITGVANKQNLASFLWDGTSILAI